MSEAKTMPGTPPPYSAVEHQKAKEVLSHFGMMSLICPVRTGYAFTRDEMGTLTAVAMRLDYWLADTLGKVKGLERDRDRLAKRISRERDGTDQPAKASGAPAEPQPPGPKIKADGPPGPAFDGPTGDGRSASNPGDPPFTFESPVPEPCLTKTATGRVCESCRERWFAEVLKRAAEAAGINVVGLALDRI